MSGSKKERLKTNSFNMSGIKDSLPDAAISNPLMIQAVQEKLQSILGKSSGYLESLPAKVQGRISALKALQSEHDKYEAEYLEEKAALELKYQKLYEPLYSKRSEIITGVTEPEEAAKAEGSESDPKGIPEFWLTALKNNDMLQEQITERDQGALAYLKDITITHLKGEVEGFKLDFIFNENPYFTNSVLSKVYHITDDDGEPMFDKAIGTEIDWNPGKNLTQKILRKKPKKGGKDAKPITKTEECESFFSFFSPPDVPDDASDLEDEEAEELQELLELDFELGFLLKDKILPHAVSWFTGEAIDIELLDDDDALLLEDDEADDEDDDDDEDDEDEGGLDEEDKLKSDQKKKKKSLKGKGIDGAEKPEECKQQ